MRGAAAVAALLILAGAAYAEAGRETPDLRADALDVDLRASPQEFLLDVWLNGRPRRLLASVVSSDHTVKLLCADLKQMGIRAAAWECAGRERIDVSMLAGVKAEIDMAGQRLMLVAGADRLAPETHDLRPTEPPADWGSADYGFIAEYDVLATAADLSDLRGTASLGAQTALTAFTPFGTLTSIGFATTTGDENRAIRLDTRIEIDDPERLRQWVIGDAISGGLRWSRPVRFGGVSLVSDFSLQPGLVTMPLPDFYGEAAVPGSVDVLIGATRVFQSEVDEGPFELNDLPVLTGGGDVTVVLHDALGRETRSTFTAYGSNQLLRSGLAAYALDAGFLRRSYGERSLDYGDLAGSATLRYGVTDAFTIETHTELTAGTAAVGGGGVVSLSPFGIVEAGGAFSTGDAGTGGLLSLAFESRQDPLTLFGSMVLTTRDYADVATVEGFAIPERRLQIGGNLSLGDYGTLAASWVVRKDRDGDPAKLATASYTLSGAGGWYVGATGFYDDVKGEAAGELFFSIALGDTASLSASSRNDENTHTHRLSYDLPADTDGGLGVHLAAEAGDESRGEAGVTWHGQRMSLRADVEVRESQTAARASAQGALVAVDDSLFATRRTGDAFALVRTGREDVRVYRENREVAKTDSDGEALLPGLIAYAANRIAVDGRDFPMSDVIEADDRIVAPRRHSVAIVDLAPPKRSPVLLTVKLPGGAFPPAGSRVLIEGISGEFVVGHHGQVFIADLTAATRAAIELPDGRCRFAVDPPRGDAGGEIAKVGPLVCQSEGKER
jgi:outer membrane usher protein